MPEVVRERYDEPALRPELERTMQRIREAMDSEFERGRQQARGDLVAVRELLIALREAIDLPHAATVGDAEVRRVRLEETTMHASIALRQILRQDVLPPAGRLMEETAYLRGRLAEMPALSYTTWEQATRPQEGEGS